MSDPNPNIDSQPDDESSLDPGDAPATPPEDLPVPIPVEAAPYASPVASRVRCLGCGYDLTGVPIGGACPECGSAVVPSFQNPAAPTNGKAITSMVLGIVSIPTCMCYGVPAIICGALAIFFSRVARKEMANERYSQSSASMSTAGLVCGIVGLVLGLAYAGFFAVIIVLGILGYLD